MKNDSLLVSVSCITFNHGKFIKECLDGILNQKVDFNFEVLINDDASTDETQDILKSYEKEYPDIIKPIFQKENQYQKGRRGFNEKYNFPRAKGKYIAFCEGDDYWVDPLKLQKQVDFLEKNKDYNLVTSYVTRYNQNKASYSEPQKMQAYSFDFKDMVEKNHSPTCATLVRNLFGKDYVTIKGWGTDSQMWMRILGKEKKGYKMGEVTSVYRKHDGGVSTITHRSHSNYKDKKAYALRKIEKAKFWNAYFDNSAEEAVKKVKFKIYKYIVSLAKREKKYSDLFLYAFRYYSIKFGL